MKSDPALSIHRDATVDSWQADTAAERCLYLVTLKPIGIVGPGLDGG